MNREIDQLAVEVIAALTSTGATVATCESLTGGLIGAALTSVPGSSAAFRGGLITYATELKHTLAGVDASELAEHGAVAQTTVEAMARGARERCGADWGIAVTGVAGPEPQEGHLAGTVWIGLAGPNGIVQSELLSLSGDRTRIRRLTTRAILRLLLGALG